MSTENIPIGFTVRTKDKKGRLTYRPDWDQNRPWISYYNGTAGAHFATVGQAKSNGFRNLETDADREAQAQHLRAMGLDIPPLPSIPVTNR